MADAAAEEAKVAQEERVEKLEEAGAAAEPEPERSAEQEAQETVSAHGYVTLTDTTVAVLCPASCLSLCPSSVQAVQAAPLFSCPCIYRSKSCRSLGPEQYLWVHWRAKKTALWLRLSPGIASLRLI